MRGTELKPVPPIDSYIKEGWTVPPKPKIRRKSWSNFSWLVPADSRTAARNQGCALSLQTQLRLLITKLNALKNKKNKSLSVL